VKGRLDYALPVEFSGAYDESSWLGRLDLESIRSRSGFQRSHLARIQDARGEAARAIAFEEPEVLRHLRAVGWDEARSLFARFRSAGGRETSDRSPEARRERRIERLAGAVLRMMKAKAGRAELGDEADAAIVDAHLGELAKGCRRIAELVVGVRSLVKFHAFRAGAQRKRFVSYKRCGQGVAVVHCACGYEKGTRLGCDIGRLCTACRDRLQQERRARFARARDVALKRDRSRVPFVGPGRWSEKHVVLTIPHFGRGRGAPTARIEAFWKAREHFGRSLQRHWRKQRVKGVRYLRGFEWTPGRDGLGHPHLHAWFWSPFLPPGLVVKWWHRALVKAGVPNVPAPELLRIRVQEVKVRKKEIIRETAKGAKAIRLEVLSGGQDLVGYLESWAVTERTEDGRIVAPWVMAEVYAALESKRQSQASRGFLGLADRECACPSCGSVGDFRIDVHEAGTPGAREWATYFGIDISRARDGPTLTKGASTDGFTSVTEGIVQARA
jgi:hypothetical protein